jgi:hypothetical protein
MGAVTHPRVIMAGHWQPGGAGGFGDARLRARHVSFVRRDSIRKRAKIIARHAGAFMIFRTRHRVV